LRNPPRFFCESLHPGLNSLGEAESRHAGVTLRLAVGDEVTLFDGRGAVATGCIRDAGAKGRGARVEVATIERLPRPDPRLERLDGGCKGPRLEWLVEKCTELSVAVIAVQTFERSIVHPGDAKLDKLRRVAIECCKQSRNPWLPEISTGGDPLPICRQAAAAGATLLLADATGAALDRAPTAGRIVAVIGPEGGITPGEKAALAELGAAPVRLSATVLRVETAAVALAAWVAAQG
jgi:16S rRNA (uracil1498-N3)-methyltransferase